MNAQQIISTRSSRFEFSQIALANSFIERSVSPSKFKTVLGDNGQYWVLTNRDALTLIAAGFELAD